MRGRYYLSRIVKLGELDLDKLISALNAPQSINVGKYQWEITDIYKEENNCGYQYIYGCLCKYDSSGTVKTLDKINKQQTNKITPDLVVASSPFIFIPEYSGISFLHVWNQIERDVFPNRFSEIICKTYDNFFVDCLVEPISDIKTFTDKIKALDSIIEISALVHPPNPHYGRVWKSINDYFARRHSSELSIKEKGDDRNPIKTKIINYLLNLLSENSNKDESPDIADAAILMAIDGYGKGKIIGKENKATIEIRTSETQKSFLFDKEPNHFDLYNETILHFKKINKERKMEDK